MATQQSAKYMFFADPGHAWLRVKRAELVDLNIAGQITPYSYQHGDYVYLEEDLDAGAFLQAKYGTEISFAELERRGVLVSRHTNNESHIRRYEHYCSN